MGVSVEMDSDRGGETSDRGMERCRVLRVGISEIEMLEMSYAHMVSKNSSNSE